MGTFSAQPVACGNSPGPCFPFSVWRCSLALRTGLFQYVFANELVCGVLGPPSSHVFEEFLAWGKWRVRTRSMFSMKFITIDGTCWLPPLLIMRSAAAAFGPIPDIG